MEVRRARPGDAAALADIVGAGLESYRAFAPSGWEPEAVTGTVGRVGALLTADHPYRGWVAPADRTPLGFAGYLPASEAGDNADDEPGLAHLRHLFVVPGAWGTPVATVLHTAVLDDARGRGFATMRLFCAAGQLRARRFYEREGWTFTGRQIDETPLGLAVVEYRRPLRP